MRFVESPSELARRALQLVRAVALHTARSVYRFFNYSVRDTSFYRICIFRSIYLPV